MALKCKTRLASWPLWTNMEIHTDPALCVQNIALTPSRWSSASTTVATRIRAGFLLSTTSNFILGWKLWGGFCRERARERCPQRLGSLTGAADAWQWAHALTALKARAGAGNVLVSAKYFSQEKVFTSGDPTAHGGTDENMVFPKAHWFLCCVIRSFWVDFVAG